MSCTICDDVCKGLGALQEHTLLKHSSSKETKEAESQTVYEADVKVPKQVVNLEEIQNQRGDKGKYACPELWREQNNAQENFNCPQCDNFFYSDKDLRKHMEKRHGGNRRECSFCNFVSASHDNLRNHIQRTHFNSSDQGAKFDCPHCDKLCNSDRDLYIHKQVHVGNSNSGFDCEMCGEVFHQKWRLGRHIASSHKRVLWLRKN